MTVTVDSRGDIVELKFNTTRYRTMAPAELAVALTGVLRDARAQALEATMAVLQPLAPVRVPLRDIATGSAGLDEVMAEFAREVEAMEGHQR